MLLLQAFQHGAHRTLPLVRNWQETVLTVAKLLVFRSDFPVTLGQEIGAPRGFLQAFEQGVRRIALP